MSIAPLAYLLCYANGKIPANVSQDKNMNVKNFSIQLNSNFECRSECHGIQITIHLPIFKTIGQILLFTTLRLESHHENQTFATTRSNRSVVIEREKKHELKASICWLMCVHSAHAINGPLH